MASACGAGNPASGDGGAPLPTTPPDAEVRDRALDPERSFIVQAPAGSGKTTLLTQRYLHLLTGAEAPEQILAITFTRKAAAEMRERVVEALREAAHASPPGGDRQGAEPGSPPPRRPAGPLPGDARARTLALARAALERDTARGWHILEDPRRLRILTMDALCLELVSRMPSRARLGEVPRVLEDAGPLYEAAAGAVLASLGGSAPWSEALATLLRHRDNRAEEVADLLVQMLGRRDQWLRHMVARRPLDPDWNEERLRAELERGLTHLVEARLQALAGRFPPGLLEELARLAAHAGERVEPGSSPIAAWRGHTAPPPPTAEALPLWQGLAELTLPGSPKNRGSIRPRARVDRGIGFPAGGSASDREARAAMKALLERLEGHPELLEGLHALRTLPPSRAGDEEWRTVVALTRVLIGAAAELQQVFARRGELDFVEVALRAMQALEGEEGPTDLALYLDWRYQHILVDEFQDTSQNQVELLRRLTGGWTPGDGRTLFAVGDPMQSIYRFREAEVGLFVAAWETGELAGVPVEPLGLSANFRSREGLVRWVNEHLGPAFPGRPDPVLGAVPHTPSIAARRHGERSAGAPDPAPVRIHPRVEPDPEQEALEVVRIVERTLAERPGGSIAILLRARSHGVHIVHRLREAGIPPRAVELQPLGESSPVQDLLALTRALFHPEDRTAWLAVLRAPWAGLELADLEHLARDWSSIPEALALAAREPASCRLRVTAAGRGILARVAPVLVAARGDRERPGLRRRVEGTWTALGGPATLEQDGDVEAALAFLELLDTLPPEEEPPVAETLEALAARLYAPPDPGADPRVQVMTIHKAKGLEFDTVVLPGLGNRPRGESRQLLYWAEVPGPDGRPDLLLAPIRRAGGDAYPTEALLRSLEQEKGELEKTRLLYVAVTRARERLHLLGHAKPGRDGEPRPDPGSLLAPLWPALAAHWQGLAREEEAEALAAPPSPDGRPGALHLPGLRRLPEGWQPPPPPPGLAPGSAPPLPREPGVEFEWAGEIARSAGVAVHRLLQALGEEGIDEGFRLEGGWPALARLARHVLVREGVRPDDLPAALARVREALEGVLTDPLGRWLLAPGHEEAACELALSGVVDGALRQVVIDRTFVDAEGRRWIVDYKTGVHSGGDREAFLEREVERYRPQLEIYGALLAADGRPQRRLLYFPLMGEARYVE